jgi:hypothetical protein
MRSEPRTRLGVNLHLAQGEIQTSLFLHTQVATNHRGVAREGVLGIGERASLVCADCRGGADRLPERWCRHHVANRNRDSGEVTWKGGG